MVIIHIRGSGTSRYHVPINAQSANVMNKIRRARAVITSFFLAALRGSFST